jgi:quinoprotein glucose dehydrogenase
LSWPERKGNGNVIPSLIEVGKKRTTDEIHNIIKMGNGRMPAFPYLSEDDRKSIIGFLLNKGIQGAQAC